MTPTKTSMPSPGPQFRAAIDRQLPQNSKYVEIRMNAAAPPPPPQPTLANNDQQHMKGSNRNAMLFESTSSSPPTSATYPDSPILNGNGPAGSRKINQPYYVR